MPTQLRFEVWVSDTGEASHWKLTRRGVFESKEIALMRADELSAFNASVCVEQWDAGRNIYLSTIKEITK